MAEDKEVDASYLQAVERLEKKTVSVSAYQSIIEEDDETSKKNAREASEQQIIKEIEIILGSVKDWSSEGEEVQLFRKNIEQSKHIDKSKAAVALPPVYISEEPAPPNVKNGFVCTVNLVKKNMKKSVKCEAHMTAEEFADLFIEKMQVAHNFSSSKDEWIFKATGTAEYLYGKHKMVDFENIRRCLKKGQNVVLSLLDKEQVLAELDPNDQLLKTVTYDFDYTKESDLPEHDSIRFENRSWDSVKMFSLWDMDRPLKIKVKGLDGYAQTSACLKNFGDLSEAVIFVCCELYMGSQPITNKPRFTRAIPYSPQPRWNQSLVFDDILLSDLPREAKAFFTVYVRQSQQANEPIQAIDPKKDYNLGYICIPLFDFKGVMKASNYRFKIWPDHKALSISTCVQNDDGSAVISVEFEKFAQPVQFPSGTPPLKMRERYMEFERKMKDKFTDLTGDKLKAEADRIVRLDPLYELSQEERWRVWSARDLLKGNDKALIKFLLSVPYGYPYAINIAYQYVNEWAQLPPLDALELLDFNFADRRVRQYAISRLNDLSDSEVEGFVLQLVQALKFELYHDSALSRFLLQRGLRSTHLIGHILFWHLKAEMHNATIRERYGLLIEEYLKTCGGHRRELLKQNGVLEQLLGIAMKVKKAKGNDRLKLLRDELANNFKHPPKFKLPLSPRMEVTGVIPEKCKVMDSKKLPLWLCFKNADPTGDPILVMFKAGDDLRQDLLTLQMLRIMDKLWRSNGLDLHMQPYGCVCTGDMTGMIEVVLNSDTIANITAARGGSDTVTKSLTAFSQDPIHSWLKKHNPQEKDWPQIVDNFALSCAGYCCATYVLGIGDRHNDNIMCTKKGDLFHIDFGHFLGHFKTFAGIKRETTPFVFTPMYAYVLGGANSPAFEKFKELSTKAYMLLRKYGNMMINLFQLMLATGIPELEGVDDILWLRKHLVLDRNEEEGVKWYHEKIQESVNNTRAIINDMVHIMAHK